MIIRKKKTNEKRENVVFVIKTITRTTTSNGTLLWVIVLFLAFFNVFVVVIHNFIDSNR